MHPSAVRADSLLPVAQHRTAESCWVVLYGDVWDVTGFLPEHPGGSSIILKLAGQADATEQYDVGLP